MSEKEMKQDQKAEQTGAKKDRKAGAMEAIKKADEKLALIFTNGDNTTLMTEARMLLNKAYVLLGETEAKA